MHVRHLELDSTINEWGRVVLLPQVTPQPLTDALILVHHRQIIMRLNEFPPQQCEVDLTHVPFARCAEPLCKTVCSCSAIPPQRVVFLPQQVNLVLVFCLGCTFGIPAQAEELGMDLLLVKVCHGVRLEDFDKLGDGPVHERFS
jgi:hypothetical protein